jgi:AcrR family transcriptional regulator
MTIEATPKAASRKPISRESILDHSSEMLAEHGVTGFRLKELAQRLNVTIPNLYRYFDDRDAIIRATYVRAQVRDAAFLCAALDERAQSLTPDSSFASVIAEFMPALLTATSRSQRCVRFQALATIHDGLDSSESPETTETTETIDEVHEATTRLFRQAQVHGLIDASINPEALSLCIRSMVLGMVLRDFGDNVKVSDDELTTVITRFCESVLAK